MPHPDGAHTHGHGGSGLGAPLAAGAGVILAAAILPALLALLHALIIALAVIAGLPVVIAAGAVIWRARRQAPVPPWQPGTLRTRQRAAVAPREVHLHLHGASPADIAAALAQQPGAARSLGSWPQPAWRFPDNPPHT